MLIPAPAALALSGITLPRMDRLKVEFDFDFLQPTFDWETEATELPLRGAYEGIYETSEYLIQATNAKEICYGWRALMAETWRAIAMNTHVKELVIDGLIAKPTSVFYTNQWRRFLGQLRHVDIQMHGGNNDPAGLQRFCSGYDVFVLCQLRDLFFLHLDAVEYLRLSSHHSRPIGLAVEDERASYVAYQTEEYFFNTATGIPWRLHEREEVIGAENRVMPRLTKLVFHGGYIWFVICEFLRARRANLRSLELHECFASSGSEHRVNVINWEFLFRQLRARTSNLQHFAIVDPVIHNHDVALDRLDRRRFNHVDFVRHHHPNRLVFRYRLLSCLQKDYLPNETWRRFMDRKDQKQYDRLTLMVWHNNRTASRQDSE